MRREKPCPEPLLIVHSDRPSVLNPQKPRQVKAIAGHFPILACLHSSAWTLSWYLWVGLGARRMVFLSSLCCSQVGIIIRPQNCAVGIVSLVMCKWFVPCKALYEGRRDFSLYPTCCHQTKPNLYKAIDFTLGTQDFCQYDFSMIDLPNFLSRNKRA